MCWSKNAMEERNATTQIVLGANTPAFCSLLNLGIYLEHMYPTGLNEDGELNYFSISSIPSTSKDRSSRLLREVFESEEFKHIFVNEALTNLDLILGSHSLRKSATTHAHRNVCSRDDIDLRGRWKKRKRQVDTSIDMAISFTDTKVASSFCMGGPIMYSSRT